MTRRGAWLAAAALAWLGLADGQAAACEAVKVAGAPLLRAEMAGCGTRLETRLPDGQRLALLRAELSRAWSVRAPLAKPERLRYTQVAAEGAPGGPRQWTLKASTAETPPTADIAAPERGLAMGATLRRRDGRADWSGELLGADDGERLGTGTRQRLRTTLLQGGGARLDATARYERLEPTYQGWGAVLPRDRETLAQGLSLRRERWSLGVDRYGTQNNLAQADGSTLRWTGWSGSLRYRPDGGDGLPQEAALTLGHAEQGRTVEAPALTGSRRETAALQLAWRGAASLRLETAHQEAADGAARRELTVAWQQERDAEGWRWHLASQATALAGDDGDALAQEARLQLQLGATPRHGPPLRLGAAGELRAAAPQEGEAVGDARFRLLASLRF
jgi:hypothetical protein